MYFWHVPYGYAGNLNDRIILSLSPLLDRMIDGEMAVIEKRSGVVPFKIGGQEFDKCFMLVDGIYPNYSRSVAGIKQPITETEAAYTAWQESVRKDIERAFGVLKGT